MKKVLKYLCLSIFMIAICFSFSNFINANRVLADEVNPGQGDKEHINTPDGDLGGDAYLFVYFYDYDNSIISQVAVADEYEITVIDNVYCWEDTLEPVYFTGEIPTPVDRFGYTFIGYDKDPYTTPIEVLEVGERHIFKAQYVEKSKITVNYRIKTEETFGLENNFYKTKEVQDVFYYDDGDVALNDSLIDIKNNLSLLDDNCDYTFVSLDEIPEVVNESTVINAHYVKNGLVTLKYYTQLVFDYAENINYNFLAYLTVQKMIPIGNEIDVDLFNTHEKVFKKYDDSLSFYNNIPHIKFLSWDKDLIVTDDELVIHGNYEMPQIKVRYIDSAGFLVDTINYDFEWFTIDEINTGKFIDYRDVFLELIRYALSFKFGEYYDTVDDAKALDNYLDLVASYDEENCKIITGFCLPSCELDGLYKGLLGYGNLEWNKRYMWYVEGSPENNDYKFLIDPEAYCSELFVPSITCTFENTFDKSVYQIRSFFASIGDFFVGIGDFFVDVWDWILNNWYWILLIVVAILIVIIIIKLIKKYL